MLGSGYSMDEYKVTIGSDVFTVEAEDNLSARYRGSELFKARFNLEGSLTGIVKHARAKLVTPPRPYETREDVLDSLLKESV